MFSPPVPARIALIDPDWTPNVPDELSVPPEIDPLVSVTPPFWVWVVDPRSRVPPMTVRLLAISPSVPGLARSSVPALMVVRPV